ncbi:hypothetical protein ACTXT7_010686 [Hymenolepis weldensis]
MHTLLILMLSLPLEILYNLLLSKPSPHFKVLLTLSFHLLVNLDPKVLALIAIRVNLSSLLTKYREYCGVNNSTKADQRNLARARAFWKVQCVTDRRERFVQRCPQPIIGQYSYSVALIIFNH